MTRQVLRLKEAQPVLQTVHQELIHVIQNGFGDWLRIREHSATFDGGPDREGIVVDDSNGVFGMILQGELFIRFKKMDSTYSVRSLYTRQHTEYMNQGQIDGFPVKPTFLFAGYIPDRTWSSIKGIYVACWIGDTLEWVDEFGRYTAEQAILDFDQKANEAIGQIEKRIKLKGKRAGGGTKTGTDNE